MSQPSDISPTEPLNAASIWQSGWGNTLGRFLALVVVFSFFAVMVEGGKFYAPRNLENIGRQSAVYATAALGMTLVIITAGIDLSIGSVIALAVVVVAWTLNLSYGVAPPEGGESEQVFLIVQWPRLLPILAVGCALLAASLAGIFNGVAIVRLRLAPFIVTLGTMGLFRGLAKGIADQKDIYPPREADDIWVNGMMKSVIGSPAAEASIERLKVWLVFGLVAVGLAVAYGVARRPKKERLPKWLPLPWIGLFAAGWVYLFLLVRQWQGGNTWVCLASGAAALVWLTVAAFQPHKPKTRPLRMAAGLVAVGVTSEAWFVCNIGVKLLLVSALVASLLLRYTRLGRHIYAIGSNQETARLCGVPVARTKIIVYTLAGFFAGLAGLMQFSYIEGTGIPTTAVSYELFVIAAVVIGGGSLLGGEGSILGSLIGALIITILYMGGQQMGWEKWVQEMVIGGIIIAAAALDRWRHRRMA